MERTGDLLGFVVHAQTTILTWITQAFIDVRLTVLPSVAGWTLTRVGVDLQNIINKSLIE